MKENPQQGDIGMAMELYFVLGVLAFILIVVCIAAEHFIASHWLKKDSAIVRLLKAIERKYPNLCDNKDSFYCNFKRDSFHKN